MNVKDFSLNGLARVQKEDGKWYYVNENLETLSEGYEEACDFGSNGLAIVRKKGWLKYYINDKFETVSEGYKDANNFDSNGLAIVRKKDWLEYYINSNFETVSEGYMEAYNFNSNGLARVQKADGKWYYINEKFETVSEGYKMAYPFGSNGLAIIQKVGGKYYYINSKCETVSEGFEQANKFASDGLAIIRKADGKYYYINEKCEIVSDGYKKAYDFGSDGLARVTTGGRMRFINKNFELVDVAEYRKEQRKEATAKKKDGHRVDNKENNKVKKTKTKNATSEELFNMYFDDPSLIDNEEAKEAFKLYRKGIITIYDLPDGCFAGDYLEKVKQNERKMYDIAIKMAKTDEQRKNIQKDYEARANFVKEMAKESQVERK
jgi:uncharacterized protein YchJ